MANIFTILQKEVEKGNTLMNSKGEFINPEKLENSMRKAYLVGLKNGSVSFKKSFDEFQQDEIETNFTPVSVVERELKVCGFFNFDVPDMPEPQETVAQ